MIRSRHWIILLAAGAAGCAEDPGNGAGYLGGEAGLVAPCPPRQVICPDGAAPTYDRDVAPLLAAKCVSCHQPANIADLTSYKAVKRRQSTIRKNVKECLMPPAPLTPLRDEEYSTIVCWATHGYP